MSDLPTEDNKYFVENIIRMIGEYHSTCCGDNSRSGSTYGANVENEWFMMHIFCWCDGGDCPWCREVDPLPNFIYKPLDLRVSWYKYIGRGMEMNKNLSIKECSDMLQNCIKD